MTDTPPLDNTAIRNAPSVIVQREHSSAPHVLLGQRAPNAHYIPTPFAFTAGAVSTRLPPRHLATPLPPRAPFAASGPAPAPGPPF